MSRKYALPFATLASVQNAGGGAYTWDATISLAIMPSLPAPVKHDCRWGVPKCEASPSVRRRNAPDATGRLMSFTVEGEEAGCFREVAGVSIVDAGSSFAVDTLTVDSRVA